MLRGAASCRIFFRGKPGKTQTFWRVFGAQRLKAFIYKGLSVSVLGSIPVDRTKYARDLQENLQIPCFFVRLVHNYKSEFSLIRRKWGQKRGQNTRVFLCNSLIVLNIRALQFLPAGSRPPNVYKLCPSYFRRLYARLYSPPKIYSNAPLVRRW